MEMDALEKWVLSSSAWGLFSRRLIVPWVLSFARPPQEAVVLDIGCGRGSEAQEFATRFPGWQLTATDYDADMVALAERRLARFEDRVRVERADATALTYPDDSFDLAVALFVWHHVGDWATATREAHRVLRPGGTLVLADLLAPAFGGPARRLPAPAGTYSLPELRSALAGAGFGRWRVRVGGRLWYRLVAVAS
ncbi:MAG TPA: class I SAM-dependent methyltransferase [Actinomycetota bacterium]|jgi:ubiquinone/menaquinone biosynthesis C-methylase UbiE|nr:class I SAM-dependent methyltransferase [Actinomycetota bacterium]